ncbi:thyrostimulin beta subunit-like protein 1 precursor [Saccoglossus kowalevskii]|uniref:Thyrostimulin beta subunit-like protein 1 n=1 Tax=Saccoglossus kowalevskii TaxID=10224 RepID=D1LXG4_SACKO|nr:thyrostimulin beta subunit-like protein 1 precursor [Saccoglossus kowalevskii]ACY92670.1 thyrostimulin beta subunit-like protein 1 [Saccoglossus kowalevskii]
MSQQKSATNHMSAVVLVVGLAVVVQATLNVNPSTTTRCLVREYNKYIAVKSGCEPQRITIDACWGRCQTFEVPDLLPPYTAANHTMCQYDVTEWRTVELSDCNPGVNRTFVYLNALSCSCTKCSTKQSDCGYGG